MAPAAVLREFLLAVERTKQPLDDAIESFADALAADASDALATTFLEIQPHADAFLHTWPDQHGVGTRWIKRESIATFFRVLATLLRTQTQRNASAAEVLALRVIREKNASLEKVLSWSDKPLIEFEALELMTALVRVNGAVAREFVRLFNFQSVPFGKLAMRRMKKPETPAAAPSSDAEDNDDTPAPVKPAFQIREAYVRLVLALTACPDKSVHRFAMKEGGVTASLFKSIDGDSVEMLAHLFAQLHALVLHNASVDAKTKTVIFNGHCVHQLLPLLQSDDESIARLALDVLNALFFDAGALYTVPRKHALRLFLSKATAAAASASDDASPPSETAYAVKVIRNAIVTIGVNEYIRSPAAQTLVQSFLTTYPGLAAEYLHALALPLEPKPGYRWFCLASLVQKLLACSLDAAAPGLPTPLATAADDASAVVPAWCSSTALATRLVLPLNCRKELSRGIQHPNHLVVYSTLGIMEAALQRYAFVLSLAPTTPAIRPTELANELRFLLPSPEALVSLLLKLCASVDRFALIYVRALVVFRLYLACLPQTMRDVKLDFTKILAWNVLEPAATDAPALASLIVSEVLRFLLAVDASRLHVLLPASSSTASAPRSKLHQLLQLYVQSPPGAIQQLCAHVLERTLLVSTVFGNDDSDASGRAREATRLWLDALRSGGPTCAAFTETLVQHVLADPFQYLETYHRTRALSTTSGSSNTLSLSPAMIALVTFFQSKPSSSSGLAAFRSEASVVVFGTRVLLSLLSIADAPQQLVALITNPDTMATDADENEDDDAALKKRKRKDTTEAPADHMDAYELLAQYCHALTGDATSTAAASSPAHKKSKHKASKQAANDASWRHATSLPRFASQLFATAPSAFVASADAIAANCLELTDSLALVLHYLGSWVGGDLVALVQQRTLSPKATSNKKAKLTATDRLVRGLPLPTLLQSVLFDVNEPTDSAIAAVATLFHERLESGALDAAAAARVCEQLLFALRHRQNSSSKRVDSALCRLLLDALSFVLVASSSSSPSARNVQLVRILRKLHDAANAATSPRLIQKLSALEIVGLRLLDPAFRLDSAAFGQLLTRAGVPTVVLLAPRFPLPVRMRLLETFLQSSPSLASVAGVLLQHVLRSLDSVAIDATPAASTKHRALAQKLWQLLARAPAVTTTRSSSSLSAFYASSFSVLSKLGGVELDVARDAIDTTLVPIITRAAAAANGSVSLTELLRRIVLAIRTDRSASGAVSFADALETALAAALSSGDATDNAHALLCAVYDAFTRIESSALRSFASSLVHDSVVHLLTATSDDKDTETTESRAQQLAFVRHALIERSNAPTDRLPHAVSTALTTLAKRFPDGTVLSATQQTALLLALRASALDATSKTLESAVVFLVKCGLQALKTLTKSPDDAAHATQTLALLAVVATIVDDAASSASPATLRAILKALGPQLTRALDFDVSARASFTAFVSLTGVFLQLVVAEPTLRETLTYDFGDHLRAITESPRFVESLERTASSGDETVDAERVALVRALYWLVDLSGEYDRALFKMLLSSYAMSLSPFDRLVRVLFDAFEERAGISLAHFGFRFGASSTTILSAADDSAAATGTARTDLVDDSVWLLSGGLEQVRVRATVEHFPLDRSVASAHDRALLAFDWTDESATLSSKAAASKALAYDPAFLLPMLAHFLSSSELPDAAVVTQGLLGIALRATSSNAPCVRSYAYGIVAHMHESLASESSDFKAGRQIHLLLESVRHALDAPHARVASVLTVFLNDAIAILCRPVHALYQHVNHFLLARPALDLHDVPMFYALFHSRALLTYKQERSWFLHTLRRGVCDDSDVELLVRRHVLPILMSFYSSELADDHTQRLVAQILTQCLETRSGATYLLTKASIVEWLSALLLAHGAGSSESRAMLELLMDLLESALTVRLNQL